MALKVLIAPGLGGSGPNHWQTIWEKESLEFERIEQEEWNDPRCKEWVKKIQQSVQKHLEVVIVAYSLACIALAFWAANFPTAIRGALLVAPPDSERSDFPIGAKGFTPIPLNRLPSKTIVVASTNDPYITIERCRFIAEQWGSEFINLGAISHINSKFSLGNWPEGRDIFKNSLQLIFRIF